MANSRTDTLKPYLGDPLEGLADPVGGRSDQNSDKRFCTGESSVIHKGNGVETVTYSNKEGTSGYVTYTGQSAFHMTPEGNVCLSTAQPAQSGSGGNIVCNSYGVIMNTGSLAIECKGSGDATRVADKNDKRKESTDETPALSISCEGDAFIECEGSEYAVRADNITLIADSVLTLKAPEINIEAGGGNGKVNIHTADYNINAAYNNKTVTGGDYTDGSGESTVNQVSPGAVSAVNSLGSLNHTVRKNYFMGVLGQYNLAAVGNVNFYSIKGGIGSAAVGKIYEGSVGPKVAQYVGKGLDPKKPPKASYEMFLGPNKYSYLMAASSGLGIVSKVGASAVVTNGIFLLAVKKGVAAIKSPTIFLN